MISIPASLILVKECGLLGKVYQVAMDPTLGRFRGMHSKKYDAWLTHYGMLPMKDPGIFFFSY